MRVAVCLFGLVGNVTAKSGVGNSDEKMLDVAIKKYNKNIISLNDVDVFLHTWDTSMEKEVRDAFHPMDAVFQEQKVFDIPSYVQAKGALNPEKRKQNHYSMWYSIKQSVALKRQWEEKNKFQYDCVMIGRFDTAWEIPVDFSSFDMNKVYTGRWWKLLQDGVDIFDAGRGPYFQIEDQLDMSQVKHVHKFDGDVLNQGLSCLWFFGNSKDMEEFSLLYDHLDTYAKPGQCPTMENTISSHRLSEYHLKQLGLYDNLIRVFHSSTDFTMIRMKYFGSKK